VLKNSFAAMELSSTIEYRGELVNCIQEADGKFDGINFKCQRAYTIQALPIARCHSSHISACSESSPYQILWREEVEDTSSLDCEKLR